MNFNTVNMNEKPSISGFTPQEVDSLLKYFVGNTYRYREQIIIPRSVGPVQIKSIDEKRVEAFFESCGFKSFVACVMGISKNNYFSNQCLT